MTRRVLCAALLLLAGCEGWRSPYKFQLERMQDQPKYLPYETSHFFADGRTMRPPPAGTVPRGAIIGRPALTTGSVEGEYVVAIPVPVTPALLALGQQRFDAFCAVCHGVRGDGQSIVATHMQLRRPPSLLSERIRALPPGHIFQVVTEGYGLMPSYAAELPVAERWAVIAYVQALQLSQAVPVSELPPAVRDSLLRLPGGPP